MRLPTNSFIYYQAFHGQCPSSQHNTSMCASVTPPIFYTPVLCVPHLQWTLNCMHSYLNSHIHCSTFDAYQKHGLQVSRKTCKFPAWIMNASKCLYKLLHPLFIVLIAEHVHLLHPCWSIAPIFSTYWSTLIQISVHTVYIT